MREWDWAGCRDAGMQGCREAGRQGGREAGMQGCRDVMSRQEFVTREKHMETGVQGCREACGGTGQGGRGITSRQERMCVSRERYVEAGRLLAFLFAGREAEGRCTTSPFSPSPLLSLLSFVSPLPSPIRCSSRCSSRFSPRYSHPQGGGLRACVKKEAEAGC